MRTQLRYTTYTEAHGAVRCDTCREPLRNRLLEVHCGTLVWRLCESCQEWAKGLKGDDLIDEIERRTGEGTQNGI